jgi:hypothetical protein
MVSGLGKFLDAAYSMHCWRSLLVKSRRMYNSRHMHSMTSYKDRTFCASIKHDGCGRELTKEEIAEADRLGLPIAWGKFCDDEGLIPAAY